MDSELQFPDPREVMRQRCLAFQQLSPDEKLRQLSDTIEAGLALIRESPNREAIERQHRDEKEAWRNIQRELIRQYLAAHPDEAE